jgi:deoxyhypusine synthase
MLEQENNEEYTAPTVKGPNPLEIKDLKSFIDSYRQIGFQGTNISLAIDEINRMRNTKIFLGFTSSIISSGLREIITHIVKYKLVDVILVTGGGVEEDLTKVCNPHLMGKFDFKGESLRKRNLNRIGNLIVPTKNYIWLEKWLTEVLDELITGYSKTNPRILTPQEFNKILGLKINNENSFLYWAAINSINVYSLALVDGAIGDIITSYPKRDCLVLDTVQDIYKLNCEGTFCEKSSGIILGGGLIKHQIMNASLLKNGLDHCVIVSTACDYDGSDSGANLEEAVSWGKLCFDNKGVKIVAEATIVFPILVMGSFLGGVER